MKSKYLALLVLFGTAAQASSDLKTVKLHFLEALAPKDTTSSERFQKDYEAAIETGKRLTAKKLASCGYQLETRTSFYDASDPLQAKEKGQKAVEDGAWLLVGPRRSNHYLLLAQGATSTPSVSIMATASEVTTLGDLHLSLSATNAEMAKIAAAEAKRRTPLSRKSYVTVVASDCLTCRDFASQFDNQAKQLGLIKLEEIQVIGEAPETAQLTQQISALKPAFVLLPNYSKLSSYLMAAIQPSAPKAFFVGADGWGDSNFGFVQGNPQVATARGFSVRGIPPLDVGLKAFPTGRQLLAEPKTSGAPYSGPALAILKTIDSTAQLLCELKPQNLDQFRAGYQSRGRKLFASPWGVSIYQLNGEKLAFNRTQGLR